MELIKQLDKQAHFWAGVAICLAIGVLFANSAIAIIVTVIIGGLKEAWDSTGRGTPDIWDFVATAIGAAVGFGILLVV